MSNSNIAIVWTSIFEWHVVSNDLQVSDPQLTRESKTRKCKLNDLPPPPFKTKNAKRKKSYKLIEVVKIGMKLCNVIQMWLHHSKDYTRQTSLENLTKSKKEEEANVTQVWT